MQIDLDLPRFRVRIAIPATWRPVIRPALLVWSATRLLNVALSVLFTGGTPAQRLAHWYFWDAGWYVGIAQHGYATSAPPAAAFFPLYPLLVHIAAPAARHAAVFIPALIVSNFAFLAALVAVGLLAVREFGEGFALAPMLLLATSPLAVFLTGMYSDGLFVALAAAALLCARRGVWTGAMVAVALAVITRPFGLALIPVLAIEGIQQRVDWRYLAVICLTPLAPLAAFCLVLWRQYGDPLASIRAESAYFGHSFLWPWQTLALAVQQLIAAQSHWSYSTAHMLIDLLPLLLSLAVLATCARKWPVSFTAYTALGLLLCLTSPITHATGNYAIVSDGRYCYALVPVLLELGAWIQHWPRWRVAVLLGLSLALQCALTVLVLRGAWLV